MPRPSVSVETIDEMNSAIDDMTDAPAQDLDFEAKIKVLVSKLREKDRELSNYKGMV